MKKLILITICAFVSFAFADSSSLGEVNQLNGACDGYGGTVTIHLTINCDGDNTPEFQGTIKTCADQAQALVETYYSLCDEGIQ